MDYDREEQISDEPDEMPIKGIKKKDMAPIARKKKIVKKTPKKNVEISKELRDKIAQRINNAKITLPNIQSVGSIASKQPNKINHNDPIKRTEKGIQVIY